MSNIGRIVANIEFIRPEGELEKYRYGVKTVPTASETKSSDNITQLDVKSLKAELSKPAIKPKADFELIDAER